MKQIIYLLFLLSLTSHTALAANRQTGIKGNGEKDSSVILIPFDYKQSALYHTYTFDVIDSVVNVLKRDDSITLTIRGYAHIDEGNDTILKYLSLDRALFVKKYILGRGIKEDRIILVEGKGAAKSKNSNVNKDGHALNCRAELQLNFPAPPPVVVVADKDGDGVPDDADACIDEFGYKENKGCPDKDAVMILFQFQDIKLQSTTYNTLDSVINVLKQNPAYHLIIQGNAHSSEGIKSVCDKLAQDRADIVKNYLLSRYVGSNRIAAVENYGSSRPVNLGRTPTEVALDTRVQLLFQK
ncbi:MAG: OmpA family protein [Bacteroidetes bacterium]|nr:OmpA family protein [Bacteroidota bacterium]